MPNSTRTDRSAINNCINRQRRKVNLELDGIVKMKCTQSAYAAMNRQDRRITEYHWDRVVQEKSLQRDLKKADRMCDRIAQVLEQLRKDFNKVKNHVGNYNFANTVGPDSSPSGDCLSDLSQAIDTRRAWKRELCNMLHMIRNYSNQQYLGDYAILHSQVPDDADVSTDCSNCCPLKHRSVFHYNTPLGDCLRIAKEVDGPGDCDTKLSPESNRHNIVSNKDLDVEALYTQLCVSPVDSAAAEKLWFDLVYGIVNGAITDQAVSSADFDTKNAAATAALSAVIGFSDELVDTLTKKPVSNHTDALTFVEAVIACAVNENFTTASNPNSSLVGTVTAEDSNGEPTVLWAGTGPVHYLNAGADGNETSQLSTLYGWRYSKDASTPTFLSLAPNIDHIEDECEVFSFVRDIINCKMNVIRECQINNDREQQTINYVRDVSECNQAYHEEVYGEMTAIDEGELCKRYEVGKAMLTDLDALYKENCVTKQSFFKDITLDGCSTW